MPNRVTISFPDGCKLLEEAKKAYSGGIGTSVIIRDALKALLDKNNSGEYAVPLPNWKQFDKVLSDASDEQFKQIEHRIKHLQNLIEAKKIFKKAVKKFES